MRIVSSDMKYLFLVKAYIKHKKTKLKILSFKVILAKIHIATYIYSMLQVRDCCASRVCVL